MGWREVSDLMLWGDGIQGETPQERERRLLARMPPADRIAMARELLAGTGKCVATEVREMPWNSIPDSVVRLTPMDAHRRGYNACRAAMMGDG